MVEQGEYKEALEFGKSVEEKHSGDSDFFFIMGSIYYMLGQANSAISYFDKSLEIKDKDIDTLLLKANVHQYLQENKKAQDCLHKILDIDPDHTEAQDLLIKLDEP